ncbi:MAG: thiamine phosphate synthase, partial [Acetobacteraceae bacterium]|nr:thiamine phosphate synthase [Acetobacteraceae bacterium]
MDLSLVAWGRAVKARRRTCPPPLWFFTDAERTPDPVAAIRTLPRGLCGVVFRHDAVCGRSTLLRGVASACRERRLLLVAAGSIRDLPVGVGRHLRGGRGRIGRHAPFLTSSAHGRAELVRAARAGASLVFLSPVFPTRSHPDARSLGPLRWGILTQGCSCQAGALGGVT